MSASAPIQVAVVDDDAGQCRSFGRLLRACGLQPTAYPSAEAFLNDAAKPRFDCLVLDIQLGGMSGVELQKHLKTLGSPTPVIFLTALDDPRVREQALETGCAAFFRKTETGATIIEAIRRVITRTLFPLKPSFPTPS
jgi:FixJ family two-component response regulator